MGSKRSYLLSRPTPSHFDARVHVAREDRIDACFEEHWLHSDAHPLAVALVRGVGVIPWRVQRDENPRRLGAVDGREVRSEPLHEGRASAKAAGVETSQGDDVSGADLVAEVHHAIRAVVVGHARKPVLRADCDDAVCIVVLLVIAH